MNNPLIFLALIYLGTTSNKGSNGAFNEGDDTNTGKNKSSQSGQFVLPGQNTGPLQLPGDKIPLSHSVCLLFKKSSPFLTLLAYYLRKVPLFSHC